MSYVTLALVIWVLFSAYRGYRKGLWHTLLGLLGFVAAYGASFLWGGAFAQLLANNGVNAGLSYLLGYTLVYFAVYYLVTLVPGLLIKHLFPGLSSQPWPGAVAGAGLGTATGLVCIWAFSLLQASMNLGKPDQPDQWKNTAVVGIAGKMMAQATRVGGRAAGMDPLQVEVLATLSEAPDQALQDIQALGASPQLQRFLNDRQSQSYLRSGNLDGVIESPPFQSLIQMDELADIRQLALVEARKQDESAGLREADLYVAERLSLAWQRMDAMRNDPQVQALLSDPEVRDLLERRDIPALAADPRVRQLLEKVMATDEFQVAEAPQTETDTRFGAADEDTPVQPAIYRWVDDSGRVRYTDDAPEGRASEKIQ